MFLAQSDCIKHTLPWYILVDSENNIQEFSKPLHDSDMSVITYALYKWKKYDWSSFERRFITTILNKISFSMRLF